MAVEHREKKLKKLKHVYSDSENKYKLSYLVSSSFSYHFSIMPFCAKLDLVFPTGKQF
jgi:hypothetical protein